MMPLPGQTSCFSFKRRLKTIEEKEVSVNFWAKFVRLVFFLRWCVLSDSWTWSDERIFLPSLLVLTKFSKTCCRCCLCYRRRRFHESQEKWYWKVVRSEGKEGEEPPEEPPEEAGGSPFTWDLLCNCVKRREWLCLHFFSFCFLTCKETWVSRSSFKSQNNHDISQIFLSSSSFLFFLDLASLTLDVLLSLLEATEEGGSRLWRHGCFKKHFLE